MGRVTEMANTGECTETYTRVIQFQLLKWCEIMYSDEVLNIEWLGLFSNQSLIQENLATTIIA